MKHTKSPSLFSFSPAYLVAALVFGLVLSLVFPMAIAAQDDDTATSDADRGHSRPHHKGFMRDRMSPEERQARIDEKFSEIDTNSDDLISPDEFDAAKMPHSRKGKRFGRKHKRGQRDGDADATGRSEEHAAKRVEMQARLFESLDGDSNGTLSQAEFAEMHAARESLMKQHIFQRSDKNADGLLSRDEFPPTHRREKGHDRDKG